MEENNQDTAIKNLLNSAKSVIVILPPDPGKDLVVAGVALHKAIKEKGKTSQIGCGSEVHVGENIEGLESIGDSIGSRNLIISFDYKEEDLDKVDYDVREDGKFYLLIKPKEGSPIPDIGGVKYSYSGASSDLVITIGVNTLEELGKIYADEKKFLDGASIISLNTSLRPSSFTSNVFHQNTSSFSELITKFLENLDLKISPPTADSLLVNIYENTHNLTSNHTTADTFSSISFLMRSGATLPQKKIQIPKFTQAPFFEIPDSPLETSSKPTVEEDIPLPEEENLSIPEDWSKPKIFRVRDDNK